MRYHGMVIALLAVSSSLESQPTRFDNVRQLILKEMASAEVGELPLDVDISDAGSVRAKSAGARMNGPEPRGSAASCSS